MEKIKREIEKIRNLYLEKEVDPFPYNNLNHLQDYLHNYFEKYVPSQSICADLNTYWMFVAGLACGGIEIYWHK